MAEGEIVRIEKLQDASQWSSWKFQIRLMLVAGDLFDVVDGTTKKPTIAADIIAWNKIDAKAQKIIGTSVAANQITHLQFCKTSKDMWDKLHSIYEQRNEMSLLLLHQKFINFVKEPTENMNTFISRLEETVHRLRDLNETISDDMMIAKIIMSLPGEYGAFGSAWESATKPNRTLDNLRSRLVIEEERLITRGVTESSEALMAKQKNKSAQNKPSASTANARKKKVKCFNCHEVGHFKNKCPKLKTGSAKTAKCTENEAFVCGMAMVCDSNQWVIDSGASDHMCHQREYFTDFVVLDPPTPITIANGGVMYAEGKGRISIYAYNGEEWVSKYLKDVLYIPELHCNLFSIAQALDKGYIFNSSKNDCQLQKDGATVAVGVRRGNLFHMIFRMGEQIPEAHVALGKITLKSWHERFGHQNVAHVKDFLKQNNVLVKDEKFTCEPCVIGKQHRLKFDKRVEKAKICGEIMHADVCGPMQETSIGGSRFFLLIKDDYSHFRFLFCLKQKSDVVEKFRNFLKQSETHGITIKTVRSDNGTEFVNKEMSKLFSDMGIVHQRTVPYTPEQNGCVEREMRTVVESARTMIHAAKLDLKFWAEAVSTAVFVLNRTGTSTVPNKTPFELWHSKMPKFDHLQPFGCDVYVHIPKEKRQKLDPKSTKCVFVGYDENVKGYRVWNPESGKVLISRDVKFVSKEEPVTVAVQEFKQIPSAVNIDVVADDVNSSGEIVVENDVPVDDEEESLPQNESGRHDQAATESTSQLITPQWCNLSPSNVVQGRRCQKKSHSQCTGCSDKNCASMAMLSTIDEPGSYDDAVSSKDNLLWKDAMDEEYDSLMKNGTWKLVNAPASQKLIDNKWVYKVKYNADGTIERYKARLVVRGFTQEFGVDYHETFSPVMRFTSVRVILSIAASEQMTLKQFDVKTAFLYGELDEDVYMKQPIGYNDGSGRVCKLIKSLYGLKQASRVWNKKFTAFIEKFEFKPLMSDPCVFVRKKGSSYMILGIYVDDGLIAASNGEEINGVINFLRREFQIKFSDATCFLGMSIQRYSDGSLHLSQAAYSRKILDRFGMGECNTVSTPADSNKQIDEFEDSSTASYPYREAVGSLMYLSVATRPDISFAVGVASRSMEKPTVANVNAVKRIFKYIKGTIHHGIKFESGVKIGLVGYSDADYAGDKQTRRSTSGYVFNIGSGPISWCSEKQKSVALSTTESEYIAASNAMKELIWLKRIVDELVNEIEVPDFYMDNQGAIRLIKNPEFHKRTKHIDVRYHFIREKYEKEQFNLHYVPTDEQLADIFTKGLLKGVFQRLRRSLNIVEFDKSD